MKYTKPVIVAQNGATGSFAAGCPEHDAGAERSVGGVKHGCKACERTK